MRKKYVLSASLFIASLILPLLTGCHEDKPEEQEEPNKKMTVLLYAVVSDLDLQSDKREILEGAANINLDENKLFVYQVEKHGLPQLLELTRDLENNPEFQVVKVYDRELYSTDPRRISGVIDDVMTMSPANDYGLIFWSHGTGWTPNFPNHGEGEDNGNVRYIPAVYSFGSDTDVERDPYYTDYTDIDELADAIPDNVFRYIWFDVCYMGGIETAYQFRDKCEYFIAMPTEDAGNGMPYHLTIPYLLKENPDCIEAARKFFDYYESGQDPYWSVATIGVCYQPAIEKVADYCKEAYDKAETPTSYGLQVYSRRSNGPFYDFGQYTRRMAGSNEYAPSIEEFEAAMSEYVVYKAATKYDFANREIVAENYSGLSCHLYDPTVATDKNTYYRTLDWYKRVYE